MSATNVDHLLQNFTVNEILDIQKKLKNDIERKKEELKQLVGERYGDLIEAADVIQDMNGSVDQLIKSLIGLSEKQQSKRFLTSNKSVENRINDENTSLENNYKMGLIMKVIVNIPLDIWSALEMDDLLSATYNYFYGKHLCSVVNKNSLANKSWYLLDQYKSAINRFNNVIVDKCWASNKICSSADYLDESVNADTFCCLLLLQGLSAEQLFHIILDQRKSDLKQCFLISNNLKECLNTFVNIVFNTIKLIYCVFFGTSGSKTLLEQRYERISKYIFNAMVIVESKLRRESKSDIIDFTISSNPSINMIESEIIKIETKNWVNHIKTLIEPLFEKTLENIDSVEYICSVLKEVEIHLKSNQKMIDWEEYCEDLMGLYYPIIDNFFMEAIIARIKTIINKKIEVCLISIKDNIQTNVINNKNLRVEDLEVVNLIWDEMETSSSSLPKKATAQIPLIDEFCLLFDDSFKSLLSDIRIIKDLNFELVKKHHLDGVESELVDGCESLVKNLKLYLDSVNCSSNNGIVTLFSAHFLRQITQSCPHLSQCFENSSDFMLYSWPKTRDGLLSYSYNFYKKWFDEIIDKLFDPISSETLTNINEFIKNKLLWDSIQISEDAEDGKVVTSQIEVPLQVSAFLHNILTQLCTQANQVLGHTSPRAVASNIISSLTKLLVKTYNSAYQILCESKYQQNINQTIAIQLYFDLIFFKQFLSTTRDDSIKHNEIPEIQQTFQKIETLIDPFDLHVFFPHIQTNIAKIGRTSSITFGLLLTDSSSITTDTKSKKSNSNIETHNILLLNNTKNPLQLLNVSTSSKKF